MSTASSRLGRLLVESLRRVPSPPVRLPRRVIASLFGVRRRSAGLRERAARVGGVELPYLVGGRGPTLVLLHGFGDDKDAFVDCAAELVSDYRVLLPDLPGFGGSVGPREFRYTHTAIVDVFTEWCDALGLDGFHLGGTSLGGAVAAGFALARGEALRSLTLLGIAGVQMPRPSPLQRRVEAGENPFVLGSIEEHDALMRFSLEQRPPIPYAVRRYMAEEYVARAPMNAKIWEDLMLDRVDLTPRLRELTMPTLVIWGDRDRLVDLSVARVLHERIPDVRLKILHGVGHCPQYEVPRETARLLREFLTAVDSESRNGPSLVRT